MSEKSRFKSPLVHWDPLYQFAFKTLLEKDTDGAQPLAVFDADGTLWRDDLGEAFFAHLVDGGSLPKLKGTSDPMVDYMARVEEDAQEAYGWVVQVMEGVEETWLASQAEAFVPGFIEQRLFPNMRSLVQGLHAEGWEVAIVSASNEWVIREAARFLGLSSSSALGIATHVEKGVLTNSLVEPMPNGAGKVDAIMARMGRLPLLASGNSVHDIPMLTMATEMAIAVEPDAGLYKKALEEDWYVVS